MGCSSSSSRTSAKPRGKGSGRAGAAQPLFPDTEKDQATWFARELAATVNTTERDVHGAEHTHTRTVAANPLAVALAEHYRQGRALMLAQRAGEVSEVRQKAMDEKMEKRARVLHVNYAPHEEVAGSASARMLDRDFTVVINEGVTDAMLVGLNADRVVETVKLFAGWVAHDVECTNTALTRSADGTRDGHDIVDGGNASAWRCELKLELRGANSASDAALASAQRRLNARIARERAHDPSMQVNQPREADKALRPAGGRCEGSLLIQAVFSFPVKDSYDRRLPWTLEVCFHFIE